MRQVLKKKASGKYENRIEQKLTRIANKPKVSYNLDPLDEIFGGDIDEKALKEIEESDVDEESEDED